MSIKNLATVPGFWQSMRFCSNIYKMRKALIKYLNDEGVDNAIDEGDLMFKFENQVYFVDFLCHNGYAECKISCFCQNEKYNQLDTSDKIYLVAKNNLDTETHVKTTGYDDCYFICSTFYFAYRRTMLRMFKQHLSEITECIANAEECIEAIEEDNNVTKQKQPMHIGFNHFVEKSAKKNGDATEN